MPFTLHLNMPAVFDDVLTSSIVPPPQTPIAWLIHDTTSVEVQ